MVNLIEQSIEQLANLDFQCSCGQHHRIIIDSIRIGSGILNEIPEILAKYKGSKVLLVADKNTYEAAGRQVDDILKGDFTTARFIYREDRLVPGAEALGKLLLEVKEDISLILAVGSGTLNDITRYVSAKTGIPYAIVATAPSMDGYASIVSSLIRSGVKTTFKGVYPVAIIGEVEIMKDAPMHMLQAGLGDVLGKYTGLADWKMAKILGLERDEYYCENISGLVEKALQKCTALASKLTNRDRDTIQSIMEGLVLSGLCIGLAGHSRPASGSEHQIAHYIEMKFLQAGISTKWLHGNEVGVATVAVLEAYEYLFSKDIEDIKASGKYKEFNKKEWTERIERCYGDMTPQILSIKEGNLLTEAEERQSRMDLIAERWDDMKRDCYSKLPSSVQLIRVLKDVGAIYSPKELGIDRQQFKDSLMVGKEIRNRYGIMQLLDDLGMLEEAAEYITSKYY